MEVTGGDEVERLALGHGVADGRADAGGARGHIVADEALGNIERLGVGAGVAELHGGVVAVGALLAAEAGDDVGDDGVRSNLVAVTPADLGVLRGRTDARREAYAEVVPSVEHVDELHRGEGKVGELAAFAGVDNRAVEADGRATDIRGLIDVRGALAGESTRRRGLEQADAEVVNRLVGRGEGVGVVEGARDCVEEHRVVVAAVGHDAEDLLVVAKEDAAAARAAVEAGRGTVVRLKVELLAEGRLGEGVDVVRILDHGGAAKAGATRRLRGLGRGGREGGGANGHERKKRQLGTVHRFL